MIRFYGYEKCSTCRQARKWLEERQITFQWIDITTSPPSKATLKQILAAGGYPLPALFNRSGELYRTMKIKDRLPQMDEAEAVDLLAKHGKLIKRPIVADPHGRRHTVGFDPDRFKVVWG